MCSSLAVPSETRAKSGIGSTCLIFANLKLFSSSLMERTEELTCTALFPESYLQDERKNDYTRKYISNTINYLIQKQNDIEIPSHDEDTARSNGQISDHINRLLMLGVTPCTIDNLRALLKTRKVENISMEDVQPITKNTLNTTEQDVFELDSKFLIK